MDLALTVHSIRIPHAGAALHRIVGRGAVMGREGDKVGEDDDRNSATPYDQRLDEGLNICDWKASPEVGKRGH